MALPLIHPGEILREKLATLDVKAAELSRQINVPANRLTQIMKGLRGITGDTALRLGHWFETDPHFWMHLQSAYDIRIATLEAGDDIAALPNHAIHEAERDVHRRHPTEEGSVMSFMDDLDDVADALSRKSQGLSVQRVALDRITPDPNQPRKVFDQKALEEMAQSIEARGILQPITLRTLDAGKTYVIRYGERRWRAAGLAGLSEIPAIVTESEADENELIDQIIENDQRADLSPIEIAEAVNGMVADGNSKEAISKRLGRSRAAISMYAAISEFPEELAGEFLAKSPLRAAYDLFVAWKVAPERVLEFVAENPGGVTSAAAAAFGRSIKTGSSQTREANAGGEGEPLHVQRPQAPASEPKNEEPERDPPEKKDERQAEARPKTPAASKPTTEVKPVFVHVSVGGRPAKVQLPDMVEVAFDDGELMTIPASKIDPR